MNRNTPEFKDLDTHICNSIPPTSLMCFVALRIKNASINPPYIQLFYFTDYQKREGKNEQYN